MTGSDDDPLRVAVIVGSTREGRVGVGVAHWFAAEAKQRADLDIDLVDLVDFDLPACYPAAATAPMSEFAARIGRADAFVVVTPEYNRSFPASLKQAIDCAYDEWHAKPAGLVSYGCRSGGMHAAEQLRSVFVELHVMTMRDGVAIDLLDAGAREDGYPDAERFAHAADTLLDQLSWWGRALRMARATQPYVS